MWWFELSLGEGQGHVFECPQILESELRSRSQHYVSWVPRFEAHILLIVRKVMFWSVERLLRSPFLFLGPRVVFTTKLICLQPIEQPPSLKLSKFKSYALVGSWEGGMARGACQVRSSELSNPMQPVTRSFGRAETSFGSKLGPRRRNTRRRGGPKKPRSEDFVWQLDIHFIGAWRPGKEVQELFVIFKHSSPQQRKCLAYHRSSDNILSAASTAGLTLCDPQVLAHQTSVEQGRLGNQPRTGRPAASKLQ